MRSFIIEIVLVCVFASGLVQGELKSVALLFRHGERTPAAILPKYGDGPLYRELGEGQLTLGGSKQLYEIGVDLNGRYKSLLPKEGYYRMSNMKITTSSSERCIASLTSFLAGFMPPPRSDKTLPIPWQSMPFAVDMAARILSINPAACDTFFRDFVASNNALEASATTRNWLNEDKEILQRLGNFVGKNITTFNDAFMVAETIRTNTFLDPATPSWLISAFAGPLKKYFIRYADMFHETQLMKKVRGGPMMTEIIDNMVAVRDKNSSAHNVLIFSAHDFSLHSMITMLNVKPQVPQIAAYGDAIAIELHQNGYYEPEVQVYYFSSSATLKFKIILHVPGCGIPCRLSTFNNLMQKYIVRDFDGMCRL